MQHHELVPRGDHFQFFVEDAGSAADTGAIWTDQAMTDSLAVGPGPVALGAAREEEAAQEQRQPSCR